MKKNLTFLTGIVFLFAILVTLSCGNSTTQSDPEKGVIATTAEKKDSTKVDIYLKAVKIDGSMHLEMYDSTGTGVHVIDGLLTVVYPGYKVKWKNAPGSNIIKIKKIQAVGGDGSFWGEQPELDPEEGDPAEVYLTENDIQGILRLDIPEVVKPDTLKYEIRFFVKDDTTEYIIDPYLQVPPTP